MAASSSSDGKTLPQYDVSLLPKHPELLAKHQTLASVLKPKYWQQLNPGLHVGDAAFVSSCKPIKPAKGRLNDLFGQINEAGVAQVQPDELAWKVDLAVLSNAVVNLVRHGWPASMLLVYDEVWAMVRQASAVMKKVTGGNMCNMDILAWLVDPNRGDVGFSPHRDRQPDDSPATFRPDGSAMYATMWVPLTPATPENSCLYVIPRFADPGYYEGDPEDEGAPDPLAAALPNKESYQNIRALPAEPGSALLFTHRTIHWGSKGRLGYPTPRISISWGCADDAYEPAYFSRDHLPCPPLDLRLALAGAQMIIYHERFPAPTKQLRLYYEAFNAQAAKFDSAYRAKVKREFVDASKEATAAAAAATAAAAAVTGGPSTSAGAMKAAKQGAGNGVVSPSQQQQQQQQKRQRNKQQQPQTTPAGGGNSSSGQAGKQVPQAAAAGLPAANGGQQASASPAAVATESKRQQRKRKKQQQQQQQQAAGSSKDVQAPSQHGAAKDPAAAAAAGAPPPAKKSKRQRRKEAAAAGENGRKPSGLEADTDEEEDGVGIDWVLLAAQANAQKALASKKSKGGRASVASAAAVESDDDDDVMDMALEAMLDGEGDFVDDYEDN